VDAATLIITAAVFCCPFVIPKHDAFHQGDDRMKNLTHVMLSAAFTLGLASSAFAAGSAEKGKETFIKRGCWQCHGTQGQGGSAGLKLAPDPLPLETIKAFVRSTNGPMPPFSEKVVSDADLEDIHAYLSSLPKSKDPKTIPLLNQ
jgi:ubiquinol-cytochrome c reductase cytochrome c subunit